MKFEREQAQPIDGFSEKQLLRGLSFMHRAVSNSRFAILSAEDGSYVQMGGGGMCCVQERRDGAAGRHFRGSQDPPVVPWPGVAQLQISSGVIHLRQEEFFCITQIEEVFLAFLHGAPFPAFIQWRDVTDELASGARST